MIEGIDVSGWQAEIDWQKAYSSGARFAIIRAGSINNETGNCWEDNYFRRNALLASALMPVSFYWFFRPNHSAVKQAEYFIGLLDLVKDKISLPHVWCDIELAGRADVVKAFCELVNVHYPIGIYTNPNTALYLLTGDKTWMRNYPLWLADWTAPANVPAPWTEYKIWQYAVKPDGAAYGMKSASLDHDQMVDTYLPPPPVPPDDHEAIWAELALLGDKIGILSNMLTEHDERLDALEQQPAPPPPAPVTMFQVTASIANARKVSGYNNATPPRPIMSIYEPRVQYHQGDQVYVEPETILADGGGRYAKLVNSYSNLLGAGVPLYLRLADGVLVS